MSSSQLNIYCVTAEIVLFNIVGLFGNLHLIWISIRKKSTHSKSGVLLGINAVNHTICLLSEFANAKFIFSGKPFTRRQCYPYIALYTYSICQQAILTLMISLDLLVALLFPFRYRVIRTTPYIVAIMILCSIYSFSVAVWGWINMNDDIIPFCNPPVGLTPRVCRFWSSSNVVINCLVVVVYALIIGFVVANAKSRTSADQSKVMRRLQVVVIVFICSWFIALLGVDMAVWLNFPPDILPIWQSNMVIFALICYSQTFYVCIWRSSEYRIAFKEQLQYMACRKTTRQWSQSTKSPSTRLLSDIDLRSMSDKSLTECDCFNEFSCYVLQLSRIPPA